MGDLNSKLLILSTVMPNCIMLSIKAETQLLSQGFCVLTTTFHKSFKPLPYMCDPHGLFVDDC